MCSVVGCDSWRRSAQRFRLPEDPERRLEWVQFLATVNKQRFRESSWTDITICREHFTGDSFEDLTPVRLRLKPHAAPSLGLQSEPNRTETHVDCQTCVESVETTLNAGQCDDGTVSCTEECQLDSTVSQGSPVPIGVSCSTDTFISVYGKMQPKNGKTALIREKAALLEMKGKYVVNEKRLLQLFSQKCPLCGSKVKVEKVAYEVLVILDQQCLQCEYRSQWKSQINAKDPTSEDQFAAQDIQETQQAVPTDDSYSGVPEVPEIVAVIDDESDAVDDSEESSGRGDMDSDEDWKPVKSVLLKREPQEEADDGEEEEEEEEKEEEDEEEEEEEDGNDDYPPLPKHSELCPDCGKFFYTRRPHTCEHKIKPYPCIICGKRCVSEIALKSHNRIHNENYEHRCKYCHVTFKTKVDKIAHEQTHIIQGKPYKCPDCSETFATNKERRIHLEDHRGPQQLKCHICGIEFLWPLSLQRHLAVHTGLKPYKCSVCQRGFNQPSHLKSHMRLHTGERPFKCQHCDKCFNHNVSLKSHIQRYHTSNSGHERKTETITDRGSDLGAAEGDENKRGADSGLEIVEEQDTDVEERPPSPKKSRRSTGRPIGRPKSCEPANMDPGVQVEWPSLYSKTVKTQMRKGQRKRCSDEDTEDEQRNSATPFNSAGEEEEGRKTVVKNSTRYRGRVNDSDIDSNFDPGEIKKKSKHKQKGAKSSGKRRGRPRNTPVV